MSIFVTGTSINAEVSPSPAATTAAGGISDWTALIDAVSRLVWPIIVAALLLYLAPEIKRIVRTRDFTVEVAGTKVSVQAAQANLQNLVKDLQEKVGQLLEAQTIVEGQGFRGRGVASERFAAELRVHPPSPPVPPTATPERPSGIHGVRNNPPMVLWISRQPDVQAFEIGMIRDLGWTVRLERWPDDIVAWLRQVPRLEPIIAVVDDDDSRQAREQVERLIPADADLREKTVIFYEPGGRFAAATEPPIRYFTVVSALDLAALMSSILKESRS